MAGKKGINLTVDEWCTLNEYHAEITRAIKSYLTDGNEKLDRLIRKQRQSELNRQSNKQCQTKRSM